MGLREKESHIIYWVIWMPSYTYGEFDEKEQKHTFEKKLRHIPQNKIIKNDISDNVTLDKTKQPLKLIVELQENLKDILLTYIKADTSIYKIELIHKDHSCNGLFLYECICKTKDDYTKELATKPRFITNYAIKELYHKHLFHGAPGEDEDLADLKIDVYPKIEKGNIIESIDIKQTNNPAIRHYLKEIEDNDLRCLKLFENHLQPESEGESLSINEHFKNVVQDTTISQQDKDALKDLHSKISLDKIEKSKEKLKINEHIVERHLYEESNKMVGRILFTNSLCHSKYLNVERDEEIRKFLLNIDNLSRGLLYIRDYYRYKLDSENVKDSCDLAKNSIKQADKGIKLSKWGIAISIASIFLTIVGIIYTFISNHNH